MEQKLEAFRAEVHVAIATATQATARLPRDGSTAQDTRGQGTTAHHTDKDTCANETATSAPIEESKTGDADGNVADEEDNDDGSGDAAAKYSGTGNQGSDEPPMFMGKFHIRDRQSRDRDHAMHARPDSRQPRPPQQQQQPGGPVDREE